MRVGKVWWHTSVGMKLSSVFPEFLQLTSSGTRYSAMLYWKCFTLSQEITILLSLLTQNTPDLGSSAAFYHTITNHQRMKFATTFLILFSAPTTFDWAITFSPPHATLLMDYLLLIMIYHIFLTIVSLQYKTMDIFYTILSCGYMFDQCCNVWQHPIYRKVLVREEAMDIQPESKFGWSCGVWLLCGWNLSTNKVWGVMMYG